MGKATDMSGIVVDEKGQPVAGAQIYLFRTAVAGPARQNDKGETGPEGTFHFDGLDADETVLLWARTKIAASDGALKVTPGGIQGKLTVTIDPSFACEIRGMATDGSGTHGSREPRSIFGGGARFLEMPTTSRASSRLSWNLT